MMLTLIPFFDRNMSVSAYSLFTRKNNFLMNPSLLGSRQFDGAAYVDGLERSLEPPHSPEENRFLYL